MWWKYGRNWSSLYCFFMIDHAKYKVLMCYNSRDIRWPKNTVCHNFLGCITVQSKKAFCWICFFFYTKLLRWFLVLYWKDLDWSIPLLKTALKCDQKEAVFVSFVSKSWGCHPKTSFPHSPLVKMENYVPIWKRIASTFLWLEGFKCLYQLLCPHQWVWPCGLWSSG